MARLRPRHATTGRWAVMALLFSTGCQWLVGIEATRNEAALSSAGAVTGGAQPVAGDGPRSGAGGDLSHAGAGAGGDGPHAGGAGAGGYRPNAGAGAGGDGIHAGAAGAGAGGDLSRAGAGGAGAGGDLSHAAAAGAGGSLSRAGAGAGGDVAHAGVAWAGGDGTHSGAGGDAGDAGAGGLSGAGLAGGDTGAGGGGAGQGGGTPPATGGGGVLAARGDCCTPTLARNCLDPTIAACVCAADPYCCDLAWDEDCVAEVESLGCEACKTEAEIREGMIDTRRPFSTYRPWPRPMHPVCVDVSQLGALSASQLAEVYAFRDRVRELFESTWQRVANIGLYGWMTCDLSGGNLIIEPVPAGPSYSELGFPGIDQSRYVYLSMAASDAEILYTFGRALGFGNEYGLERLPGDCQPCTALQDCTGPHHDTCLESGYCGLSSDQESLMAAPGCGGIEATRRLTPWDVFGAVQMYGRRATGSLVSSLGQCAHIFPAGEAWAGDCYATAESLLVQIPATVPGQADLLASSLLEEPRCVESELTSNPSPITYQVCDPASPGQDFRFAPARLRSIGGVCIVAPSATVGAALESQECAVDGAALEWWHFRDGLLRLHETSLCATVAADPPAVGDPIVLAECGLAPARQTFEAVTGTLRISSGDCLNVASGLPANGKPLILWNGCHMNYENERFYLSGPLAIAGGQQCLESGGANSPIFGAACAGSIAQEWDFHL